MSTILAAFRGGMRVWRYCPRKM